MAGIAILVSQLSLAEHHEAAEPKAKIVIGHEISDEGERMDITAGDLAAVELLKSYVEAHNRHDTAAIGRLNASDFKAWAANGVVIDGSDAHIAFLKDWFASSSPTWKSAPRACRRSPGRNTAYRYCSCSTRFLQSVRHLSVFFTQRSIVLLRPTKTGATFSSNKFTASS